MDFRKVPGILAMTAGVVILAWLITNLPSGDQGGPAFAYALIVITALGGAGSILIIAGLCSMKTRRIRLPMMLLAGYGIADTIYVVIRLDLFHELTPLSFTVIALGFGATVLYGTFKLTDSEYWLDTAADTSRE